MVVLLCSSTEGGSVASEEFALHERDLAASPSILALQLGPSHGDQVLEFIEQGRVPIGEGRNLFAHHDQ